MVNPAQAFELLTTTKLDCVILDLDMAEKMDLISAGNSVKAAVSLLSFYLHVLMQKPGSTVFSPAEMIFCQSPTPPLNWNCVLKREPAETRLYFSPEPCSMGLSPLIWTADSSPTVKRREIFLRCSSISLLLWRAIRARCFPMNNSMIRYGKLLLLKAAIIFRWP